MFFLDLLSKAPILAFAWAAALVLSLTVHEFAHAVVGKMKGDDTAERMGRLTLNPLAHLDVMGILMLLFVGFGWAKPVPFTPAKLKNPLIDGMLISLAGPAANLFFALLAAAIYHSLLQAGTLSFSSALPVFLIFLILINASLLFFNLIPVAPLDGSKVVDVILYSLGAHALNARIKMWGPRILLVLVVISIATSIPVFIFVSLPAAITCDAFVQASCSGLLSQYLPF